jgi:quercetin dioxygenase-like cupin family protein
MHYLYDSVISIYYMDAGDKIPRHIHPNEHTTACLAGETEVDIDDHPLFHMKPGEGSVPLPPKIYHEVRAMVDGTIVMHVMEKKNIPTQTTFPEPNYVPDEIRPGVLMDNGTIEYPDEE